MGYSCQNCGSWGSTSVELQHDIVRDLTLNKLHDAHCSNISNHVIRSSRIRSQFYDAFILD